MFLQDYENGVPEDIKIACFGSTYAKYAYSDFSKYGIKGFNFALKSQSVFMDSKIFKQYKDKISNGGIVIITICPCTLLLYKDGIHETDEQYYHVLPVKQLETFRLLKWMKAKYPILFNPGQIKYIFSDAQKSYNLYTNPEMKLFNHSSIQYLNHLCKSWKTMFDLEDLKKPVTSLNSIQNMENNKAVLEKWVKECLDAELKPVIVTLPFSNRLNEKFSTEFVKCTIENNVLELCQRYNVPYFNYRCKEEFQDAYHLFMDGGFRLNQRGSQIFMELLMKDLKKYKLL